MKILFFSPYFIPYISGTTTHPHKVLKHLAKNHQVTVLTFNYDSKLETFEVIDGINVHRLSFLVRVSKGFFSPQSLISFLYHVRRHDVILINLPSAEGLPLVLLSRLIGKKVVSIFHCQVDLGPSPFQRIITQILKQIVNFQLTLSTKITAYTKDYIQSIDWGNSLIRKTTIIPPPVCKLIIEEDFLHKLSTQKGNRIWIGFAGRIAREKGIEYAISAIDKLKLKDSASFVFSGPYGAEVSGEEEYYHKIITLLDRYNINYTFFGTLRYGQLGAFYKSIDILVLPSINQTEAFGMVQAEAMMIGTPVVTTDLPGVRYLVNQTGMGIVVPPKNSNTLAEAISQILENRTKYVNAKNSQNLRKIINQQQTLQSYERLIKEA